MLDKHQISTIKTNFPFILYGADYNPDQWSQSMWQEDIRLMKKANINVATLPVFSWTELQPNEDTFNFEWLDKIISMLTENNICITLATPTAAEPAWMSEKYPEVLRSDNFGNRNHHGRRINYCPNSNIYRRFAAEMACKLATRYKDNSNILLWHVSNEYSGACYCDNCAAAFREWLKEKYSSLEELNRKWYNKFWSHTYTDWQQIAPPYKNGENLSSSLSLDYMRFMDNSMLNCFNNEAEIIRQITPNIPITTNMMGPRCKEINSRQWAKYLDVVSWDSYPLPYRSKPANIAFRHNCLRAVKDGQPFLLMEQTPSNKLWAPVLSRKAPGLMRLWSYQALAHGAESVMFFQWRRGLGGCEKLHGAIIESDKAEHTRVFKEISELGSELKSLGNTVLGATCEPEVALLFDWESYWATDLCVGPIEDKCYVQNLQKYHEAFFEKNIQVDIVFPDGKFDKYKILVAPMLYILTPDVAEKLKSFVKAGGILVTTTFSGMANENDLLFNEGFLGPLQEIAGIWIEEIDALYEDQFNVISLEQKPPKMKSSYKCARMCDTIHTTTAKVVATYGKSWQKGTPVITANSFEKGTVYYIGTEPEQLFINDFIKYLCDLTRVYPPMDLPCGVEVFCRQNNNEKLFFILNHNEQETNIFIKGTFTDILTGQKCSGEINLEKYGVKILKEFQ